MQLFTSFYKVRLTAASSLGIFILGLFYISGTPRCRFGKKKLTTEDAEDTEENKKEMSRKHNSHSLADLPEFRSHFFSVSSASSVVQMFFPEMTKSIFWCAFHIGLFWDSCGARLELQPWLWGRNRVKLLSMYEWLIKQINVSTVIWTSINWQYGVSGYTYNVARKTAHGGQKCRHS